MRIERVEIEDFGKLSGLEWEPHGGFQVVFGGNEDGKSTLMAFLKMMLYGDTGRQQAIGRNPRKRYRPWNGKPMRGAMEFTADGKAWRLEKTFGETAGRDLVRLLERETGRAVPLGKGEEVGARFLGLQLSEFERTCFVGSTGAIAGDSQHDDITKRLMENLSASGEESVSPQEVLGRLRGAAEKLVSKRGNRGELAEAKQRLEALHEEKARVLQQLEEQKALRQEYGALWERQKRRGELRRRLEAAQAYTRLNRLDSLIAARRSLDEQEVRLGQPVQEVVARVQAFETQIMACERLKTSLHEEYMPLQRNAAHQKRAYDEAREAQERLEAAWKAAAPAEEERERLRQEKEALLRAFAQLEADERAQRELAAGKRELARQRAAMRNVRVRRRFSPVLLGIGVCLIVAFSVAAVATHLWPLLAGAAAGLILLALAFVKKPASAQEVVPDEGDVEAELRAQEEALRARREELDKRQQAVDAQWNALPAREVYEAARSAWEEARMRTAKEESRNGAMEETLRTQYALFTAQAAAAGVDMAALPADAREFDAQAYAAMLEQVAEQKRDELAALLAENGCASVQELRETLEGMEARRSELIHTARGMGIPEEPATWQEEREACRQKAGSYNPASDPPPETLAARLEALGADEQEAMAERMRQIRMPERLPEQIQAEIDALLESVREMEAYYRSLTIAAEAMEQAVEELRQSFSPALNQRTGEILAALTGDKYSQLLVSPSYELRMKAGTQYYMYAYLSDGTVDQGYLSLRLAIAERISPAGDPLPIFLDDALMQYDDERTVRCLRFLQKYAAETGAQIVLFTCHGYVADEAAALSVPCLQLPKEEK